MSTLLESIVADNEITVKPIQSSEYTFNNNKYSRHICKRKNVLKPKCNKALKRKLKKYRLRKDGKEDQEILDVSQTLLSSLKIKSPNSCIKSPGEKGELKPKNYLFKMARRKLKTKSEDSATTVKNPKALELASPINETQEKKQTNAFKLLMDSRNKSIGSNSPGKEKTIDESEMQEFKEEKVNKTKRNLALQKMAEAKGALKNKEIEELKDQIIQKKMEMRAERLKTMIEKKKSKLAKKNSDKTMDKTDNVPANQKNSVKTIDKTDDVPANRKTEAAVINQNKKAGQAKTLQLISMFSDADTPKNVSAVTKCISKEDKEFLKKLSPSLRKKENILCKNSVKTIEKTDDVSANLNTEAEKVNNQNKNAGQAKTLQLISIVSDAETTKTVSAVKKYISKEDEEFLKKLSPSLKKKENMLCYFKKIEKNVSPTEIAEGTEIIKVKATSKVKKRIKKKRLSLHKEPSSDVLKDHNEKKLFDSEKEEYTEQVNSEEITYLTSSKERRKRKRKENILNLISDNTDNVDPVVELIETNQGRPKRNVKRPIKYIDDVQQLSSSEEELHIFTPKKRKHIELKTKQTTKEESDEVIDVINVEKEKEFPNPRKRMDKNIKTEKKPTKLAPIFAAKPQINPAELEAKQKFLYSGVPDQLKKIITQQKNANIALTNDFQAVIHVQQIESTPVIPPPVHSFNDLVESDSEDDKIIDEKKDCFFKQLLSLTEVKSFPLVTKNNKHTILKDIKELYPKFPVYRTYKLLKGKRKGEYVNNLYPELDNSIEIINGMIEITNENPCNLKWTDKYKPLSTNHMLGNFHSIKELKKWLISWKENKMRPKNAGTTWSDSSDFYESETDSRDSTKAANNLLILNGPVGSGKTCSIYAVAAELAIKVIEVNASSKRTGKVMLQELHEATQSHKVNRGNGSTENSQKSQEFNPELKVFKNRGRPKKSTETSSRQPVCNKKKEMLSQASASQENVRTVMSLILIDDADIVFEQDDGFSSAIAQLVHCSKRPVILVTSSLECPHLQKFLQCGKVMNMHPFLPRMLGTWLDIMCLADNGLCWPGLGSKTLDFFKGDIRKTINCLQFYVTTHNQDSELDEETMSQKSEYKSSIDDENSSMSWADQEASEEKNVISKLSINAQDAWKCFMGNQSNLLHLKYPCDLFNIWWSVPSLLHDITEYQYLKALTVKKSKKWQDLETVANAIDAMSICDYFSQMKPDSRSNISSSPWYSSECDSVSENQCFEQYNRSNEIGSDIMYELVTSSIVEAQRCLDTRMRTEINFPGLAAQRSRGRTLERHDDLTCYLNPSAALDRRALALDYWSSCRAICRIEKNKTDTTSKRNNRFCHYLKSLNFMSRSDVLDKLADCLNPVSN